MKLLWFHSTVSTHGQLFPLTLLRTLFDVLDILADSHSFSRYSRHWNVCSRSRSPTSCCGCRAPLAAGGRQTACDGESIRDCLFLGTLALTFGLVYAMVASGKLETNAMVTVITSRAPLATPTVRSRYFGSFGDPHRQASASSRPPSCCTV